MAANFEKEANDFDCDLYRLIMRAGRFYHKAGARDRKRWDEVARGLISLRGPVRNMMSDQDRKGTTGDHIETILGTDPATDHRLAHGDAKQPGPVSSPALPTDDPSLPF